MTIIYDKRLPGRYKRALRDKLPFVSLLPFEGTGVPDRKKVYASISCHPDVYFFQLDGRTLIHAPGLSEDRLRPLKDRGAELIRGEGDPSGRYPDTARYNALRIGNCLFHNLRHTDPAILEAACEKGLKTVNVNQGYTRCSSLALSDSAVITADKGIAAAAAAEGIDTLLLSPGSVLLPGERHGFIGGAGGRTPDGTLILLGDMRTHPESPKIEDFLTKHAARCVFLEGLPLYDAGGIVIV